MARLKTRFIFLMLCTLSFLGWCDASHAQDLQVTFGSNGIQTLSYRGLVLEDVGAFPADAFHIWHMKCTDSSGNPQTTGQYGWGESNNGRSWDAPSQTMTYTFVWGTIRLQFKQTGNNLDMLVTQTNNAGSGVVFDGAEIYPFAMHFPQEPLNFYGYSQYAITTTGPGVSAADYGSGIVTSVVPDESIAIYGGWKAAGNATYTPLMSTTTPDGLANFLPRNDQPVQPGASLTYTVSLRFTPEGTSANASDGYSSFSAKYPSQMTWADKRIIGTAWLSSSVVSSNINQPNGFPTNPRRYFNDASVDVTTAAGLLSFQGRILQQAKDNVTNLERMNAQGLITWDVEGQQYPQSTSYVCSPDQIGTVAPEMESIVTDSSSAYVGMKLDDAYFKTMVDAGERVGVCLRPQVFTMNADRTAAQVFLTGNQALISNLENKVKVANSRWGVTMFYVDSNVDPYGGTLDPAIYQQLITDFPNFLFIPEESTPRYYAYTAPFYTFIFHGDLGTPTSAYSIYPGAFGANLVNDVDPTTLATYTPQLTQSVANGDILMGHADYWQANDPTLMAIYQSAGVKTPVVKKSPVITWASPVSATYGTALSAAQLNATANVAGTFTFTPSAGAVLSAGTNTLSVVFTPADPSTYNSSSAKVTWQILQATPILNWPAPAAVVAGTKLSVTQLNASANVAGALVYTPAAGQTVAVGSTTLAVLFSPADAVDYTTASATRTLTVLPVPQRVPIISWTNPASVVYGTALSSTQLNAKANTAGTFTYSPGSGAILNAGIRTLVAAFTPQDATWSSAMVSKMLTVTQAKPLVSWASPAAITAGTALSGSQLNATANVSGTFAYSPAAGTAPAAGRSTLSVTFTPADSLNYSTQVATVVLTVQATPAAPVQLAILSPTNGQILSGVVNVTGLVNLNLDAAGSFLIVDGQWQDQHRVTGAPYVYRLNTTTLVNGAHTLQLWAHDIGNNTTLSNVVSFTVQN